MLYRSLIILAFSFSAIIGTNSAYAALDNDAAIVHLRTSCTENGADVNNCFTDLATLTNWIFNTRSPSPSAQSPLIVQIGPGTFNGQFICSDSSHITLNGAGMQNTIISAGSYPVALNNCNNMTFRGMTLKASGLGVQGGGGVTFWHDIELDASGFYAWLDGTGNNSCYTSTPGKHYWFSSRIIGRGLWGNSSAYQSSCDESWFFGSEIVKYAGNSGAHYAVKSTRKRGETHIYGGVVRVIAEDDASVATLVPIRVQDTGLVHVHGTGIDTVAEGANTVQALSASNSSMIHANSSSYSLTTGPGGSITRISRDATSTVMAPYQWEPQVLNNSNFASEDGQDSVIEIVCNGGNCVPHNLIYMSSCTTNGPWYDTATQGCRL